MKFIEFKQVCQRSLKLLLNAHEQNHLVTTEYVTNLQAKSSLLSNFSINRKNISITEHQIEIKSESWFKDEGTLHEDTDTNDVKDILNRDLDYIDDVDLKFEDSTSDEEPLSNKKDRKKKPNKINVKIESDDGRKKKPNKIKVKTESDDDDSDFLGDSVEVTVLTKEEQIQEVKARKESLNYNNSFYKCDLCYKGFLTNATYKNHMVRHDPSKGRHACDVCHSRFTEARHVRRHIHTTHACRYTCKMCTFVARTKNQAKEHTKWHGGHKYTCKICGAEFDKSTSHLSHVRIHHPSEHYCNVCGETFVGEFGLKQHKKKAHRANENDKTTEQTMCLRCGVSFHTAEALGVHSNYDGDCSVDVRPCVQCGVNFDSNDSLDTLKEHLKRHSKEEPVKCEECNRTFPPGRAFEIHYQTVHLGAGDDQRVKKKMYERKSWVVCEVCGKKCICKAALLLHQRTHTGEKPHVCALCSKKFRVYSSLQIHLRTHTGEAPYKCRSCPKAFKDQAALTRHDKVHTGEKPYSCAHCGKCFSQSNSMKMHVRTVHLKLPELYRGKRNRTEKQIRAETTLSGDPKPAPARCARSKRPRPAHSVASD